jgi:sec-independent protein translocase protein TatA
LTSKKGLGTIALEVDRPLVGLLDFKSSGGCRASAAGSIPVHFRHFIYTVYRYRKESAMFGIGMPELLIILGIAILVFGATRLPEIGSGIGKAIRNFKRSINEPPEIDVTPDEEENKKIKSKKKSER